MTSIGAQLGQHHFQVDDEGTHALCSIRIGGSPRCGNIATVITGFQPGCGCRDAELIYVCDEHSGFMITTGWRCVECKAILTQSEPVRL